MPICPWGDPIPFSPAIPYRLPAKSPFAEADSPCDDIASHANASVSTCTHERSKRTLTAALEAGDLQAAVAAFRQDIVFHSPILATVGDEVRGLLTLSKILQTAFTCLGTPQNVEEFQNPDGRYIVTFDGAIDGNLIQIAMLVTEDAQAAGTIERIAAALKTDALIRSFFAAAPVLEVFRVLGRQPPIAEPPRA